MKFLLNGNEEELPGESVVISRMLEIKKFSFKMRIIKINGVLISKENYGTSIINDGDNVQMIYLMSGG